jgi:hypothetical protein
MDLTNEGNSGIEDQKERDPWLVWLISRDNSVVSVAATQGAAEAWVAYRVKTSSERDKRGEKKRYSVKRWVVVG